MAITIAPAPEPAVTHPTSLQRMDGGEVWTRLSDADRNEIGAAAIELVAAWYGEDVAPDNPATEVTRAFEQAVTVGMAHLEELVLDAVPMIHESDQPPMPSCGLDDEE